MFDQRRLNEAVGRNNNCAPVQEGVSNALASPVLAGSLSPHLSLHAEPSDLRVRASPVRGPLRAIRVRSALPTAAAPHDAIPSTAEGAPGSSRPGPGESG